MSVCVWGGGGGLGGLGGDMGTIAKYTESIRFGIYMLLVHYHTM